MYPSLQEKIPEWFAAIDTHTISALKEDFEDVTNIRNVIAVVDEKLAEAIKKEFSAPFTYAKTDFESAIRKANLARCESKNKRILTMDPFDMRDCAHELSPGDKELLGKVIRNLEHVKETVAAALQAARDTCGAQLTAWNIERQIDYFKIKPSIKDEIDAAIKSHSLQGKLSVGTVLKAYTHTAQRFETEVLPPVLTGLPTTASSVKALVTKLKAFTETFATLFKKTPEETWKLTLTEPGNLTIPKVELAPLPKRDVIDVKKIGKIKNPFEKVNEVLETEKKVEPPKPVDTNPVDIEGHDPNNGPPAPKIGGPPPPQFLPPPMLTKAKVEPQKNTLQPPPLDPNTPTGIPPVPDTQPLVITGPSGPPVPPTPNAPTNGPPSGPPPPMQPKVIALPKGGNNAVGGDPMAQLLARKKKQEEEEAARLKALANVKPRKHVTAGAWTDAMVHPGETEEQDRVVASDTGNMREQLTAVYEFVKKHFGRLLDIAYTHKATPVFGDKFDATLLETQKTQQDPCSKLPSWALSPKGFAVAALIGGTGEAAAVFSNVRVNSYGDNFQRALDLNLRFANKDFKHLPLSDAEVMTLVDSGKGERPDAKVVNAFKGKEDQLIDWTSGSTDYIVRDDHYFSEVAEYVGVPTVAGPSGTTTLYLYAGQYLKLTTAELKGLRQAMLAWMLTTRDHSFLEIMDAAETISSTHWAFLETLQSRKWSDLYDVYVFCPVACYVCVCVVFCCESGVLSFE